ncbi:MAG: helix-turn-helix domain-containing protein [Candidatus Woesearchaeota archaeon]
MRIGVDLNNSQSEEENKKYGDVLEGLGFSKNEVKVYISLLEIGSGTAGMIADKSKIHRTNVYEALNRLIKKGVVSYIIKNDVKYFEANDPNSLMQLMREKEEKLNQIIPELSIKKRLSQKKDVAHLMEGIQGVKAVTEDILKCVENNGFVLTFGCPKDISKRMKSFIDSYHRRRIAKKITQIHIYNENAKERIAYLNKLPYTKADYLPKEYNSPATTTIYDNKVSFWIWDEVPLVILIESKKMADAYRKYFWLLWSLTKLGKKEKINQKIKKCKK